MIRSTVNAITHSLIPTSTAYDVKSGSAYTWYLTICVAFTNFDDSYIFYVWIMPGQYKRHSER